MRYVGENCPYCGVAFSEQDDVVVCPECATPHHRVCWFAHGECANTEKHGTDFVWKKSSEPQPEPQPGTQPENQPHESRNTANLDIVCPDCGTTCPNGTLRCPECGAMLIPFANQTGAPPMAQFRQDFDPTEDIGGIKSGDIALFCRTAGANYIKKFRKLAHGSKVSFNWAALIFSPFWFFYRKLFKAGAFFVSIYIALNLLLIPAQQYFYDVSNPITVEMQEIINSFEAEDGSYDMAAMQTAISEFIEANYARVVGELIKPAVPMYLIMFLLLVLNVVAALLADRLYYQEARRQIPAARLRSSDERSVQLELFRKGGTNILLGAGIYFACNIVSYAASYVITML